eukprot:scaffold149_cov315-Pinguiococcus_pyrenoidosus.AAC.73
MAKYPRPSRTYPRHLAGVFPGTRNREASLLWNASSTADQRSVTRSEKGNVDSPPGRYSPARVCTRGD